MAAALELLDWGLALVPVLVLLAMFIWLDVFKLMTAWETLSLLLLGAAVALVSYPISGRMLDTLPIGFSTYSRFVAPWIEEALKGFAIIALFQFNRIGFKLDAVISGFAVGAGFSVIENIIYLTRFPELPPPVWMVRGLGTAVMHGTTLAIMAAVAHELGEKATRGSAQDYRLKLRWFLPGFAFAVALHTAFNQFPDRPMLAMLGTLVIAPVALLAIFRFGAAEAQEWLATERAQHSAMLEALKAGRFPDDASGRRIAALARRCDPEAARHIQDYVRHLTWLVLAAEETLAKQSATAGGRIETEARAAFERLDASRRKIGRSTFAVLKPLLPFSRNDYWELSELRERLRPDKGAD